LNALGVDYTFMIVGLYMATRLFPSLGSTANVRELNTIMTKASFLVQHTSSTHKLVFPRESNDGQSSGRTKSKSFKHTLNDVSKLVKSA
jgi:hypothetical protein